MCVVSIPRLFDRLIQNLKEFFDPTPLGADSGGGARGQRGETSLAYLQPCVCCLYLGYLIGWFSKSDCDFIKIMFILFFLANPPLNPPQGGQDQENSFRFWINLSNNIGIDTTHMVEDILEEIHSFATLPPLPNPPSGWLDQKLLSDSESTHQIT